MISGQNDIITFIEFKIKNTDTESMKEQILSELEKLKSNQIHLNKLSLCNFNKQKKLWQNLKL